MKKLLIILSIILSLVVLFVVSTPMLVGAVSGVDNATAYTDALQSISQTTISSIGEAWTGTANTLGKGIDGLYKVFEKAIAP